MLVRVTASGQSLRWYGKPPELADNSIQFVQWDFSLSEDWLDLEVVAQFKQQKTYNCVLKGFSCLMPPELTCGVCEVSLFGYSERGSLRATTTPLRFTIKQSGFTEDGETPIPPTPDLYTQLLQKISESLGYAVPLIKEDYWWVWDAAIEEYVSTGVPVGASQEQVGKLVEDYLKKNPAKQFDIDEITLHLEGNMLSVKTVDEPIKDDQRPITSNAVYDEFSKAVALLRTI